MKKLLMMGMAAMAALVGSEARALTLAEAASQVAAAAETPETMASVMSQLSAEDQIKFLASVNESIESMPVSDEKKAALFIAANEAAMKAAQKGNLPALLAETYATVPLEVLTVLNERFATDLFSRTADATRPITDEAMKEIAVETMKVIQARNEKSDVNYAAQRNTFAVLMFLRAANGSPADLKDVLLAGYPADAAAEWVPAALGEGEPKSYEPMLAIGMKPVEASTVINLLSAPHVLSGSMILNLGVSPDGQARTVAPFHSALLDPNQYALPRGMDYGVDIRIPKTLNKANPWYNDAARGDTPSVQPQEPGGYYGQQIDSRVW